MYIDVKTENKVRNIILIKEVIYLYSFYKFFLFYYQYSSLNFRILFF
jgi:hypothetical protein